MPKMPDWLGNMTNSAPNLVEDSPQFRAEEQKTQMANLNKASEEAIQELQRRRAQSQADTIRANMRSLDAITPQPTLLSGPNSSFFPEIPPEMHTPMTPNVPSPDDFASDVQPQPFGPPDQAPAQEDPVAEAQRISDATGIPVQTVAGMALLGQDIGDIERNKQQPFNGATPNGPSTPFNGATPSAAPPQQSPAPLMVPPFNGATPNQSPPMPYNGATPSSY